MYSLLLLSGNTKLAGLGIQIAFAGLRFALAATKTTGFLSCMDTSGSHPTIPQLTDGLYKGELYNALQQVPRFSGVVVPGSPPAATPLELGPDGTRVICASIAMMSGNPATEAAALRPYTWERNLMWQAAADITNAIYQTIVDHSSAVIPSQVAFLCKATRAIYTFSEVAAPTAATTKAVVTVPGPTNPINEVSASCSTTGLPCNTQSPTWPAWVPYFTPRPTLVSGHNFNPANSPLVAICSPLIA